MITVLRVASLLRLRVALALIATLNGAISLAQAPERALANYVAKPDPTYGWQIERRYSHRHAEVLELRLRSQTWQGVLWQHRMLIIRPDRLDDAEHALLIIGGGRFREDEPSDDAGDSEDMALPSGAELFVAMARALRSPVVVVAQVPFQPLFDLTEDRLIAHSFERYLATGDEEWPLLLPMVKSTVRALDASSEASLELWGSPLKRFTLLGGSKRGWTTWLTAAVEPRVTALAPIVIDALNMERHFPHQTEMFGAPSEEIQPYTDLDLPNVLGSSAGAPLRAIVDPYSYRRAITQPKLVVLATNDRYFPVDSANLYWDGLVGPKYLLYLPNEPHSVQHYGPVVRGLRALHESAETAQPLPSPTWEYRWGEREVSLCVNADTAKAIKLWRAESASLDFRDSQWSVVGETKRSGARFDVVKPGSGYEAFFAEVTFGRALRAFSLTTALAVVAAEGERASSAPPSSQPGVCELRAIREVLRYDPP